jgi:hypothetical protein
MTCFWFISSCHFYNQICCRGNFLEDLQREELFTFLPPYNGDAQDYDIKAILPKTFLPLRRHCFIESGPVGTSSDIASKSGFLAMLLNITGS